MDNEFTQIFTYIAISGVLGYKTWKKTENVITVTIIVIISFFSPLIGFIILLLVKKTNSENNKQSENISVQNTEMEVITSDTTLIQEDIVFSTNNSSDDYISEIAENHSTMSQDNTIKIVNDVVPTNIKNDNKKEQDDLELSNSEVENIVSEQEIQFSPSFCRFCGTKLNANSIYCHKCGKKITN